MYELILHKPLDPHIYTPQEFMQMLQDGKMTTLDSLTEGIILHAEKRFLREVKKTLEEVLKKRVKVGNAWVGVADS